MKLLYWGFYIVIAAMTGCVTHNADVHESQDRTQLLADLFRSIGDKYKVESYGFNMSDEEFANLQANFEKNPPAYRYRQEKTPTGQETVITIKSVLMRGQTAEVTLEFTSRDAFYDVLYTLHPNSGIWKIVDKKILFAT